MKSATKTTVFAVLSAALALGAANAYAADAERVEGETTSRTWTYTKTAVTSEAALETRRVIRTEDVPEFVVPLNTDVTLTSDSVADLRRPVSYRMETDLRDFDLLADEPVFIGAQAVSDFDTLRAQQDRAGFSDNLGVDPLVPVAGAGLNTTF